MEKIEELDWRDKLIQLWDEAHVQEIEKEGG